MISHHVIYMKIVDAAGNEDKYKRTVGQGDKENQEQHTLTWHAYIMMLINVLMRKGCILSSSARMDCFSSEIQQHALAILNCHFSRPNPVLLSPNLTQETNSGQRSWLEIPQCVSFSLTPESLFNVCILGWPSDKWLITGLLKSAKWGWEEHLWDDDQCCRQTAQG